METVFIAGGFMVAVLFLLSQSLAKGVGTVGGALQQIGLFILRKNPPGLVDIFDDKDGSGSRTWMNFGMLWMVLAGILGFLGAWHNYDPSALDSLASIGWSYDDGSSLRDATLRVLSIGILYGLVGSAMVATARNGNGRLASEANASMVAVLLSGAFVASYLLPFIFGFLDVDTETGAVATFLYSLETVAVGALLIPILINVLITASMRGEQELQTSVWFLIMGLTAYIISMLYMFFGELADATQTVWFAERVSVGWVPLALMFSVGYHVIPMTAKQPIWSGSIRTASMFLLFVTVPTVLHDRGIGWKRCHQPRCHPPHARYAAYLCCIDQPPHDRQFRFGLCGQATWRPRWNPCVLGPPILRCWWLFHSHGHLRRNW